MPPARSSLPSTGLNLTSTNPSVRETSLLAHQGNVPWPDCLSTFGLLGAVLSGSTAHLGVPRPVTPQVQLAGIAPVGSWSNPVMSANAATTTKDPASTTTSCCIQDPCGMSFLNKSAARNIAVLRLGCFSLNRSWLVGWFLAL